jgi:plasmid stabilization system protein ParE
MRLRYSARAKDDLHIAFNWYETQRRGLGLEFLDCVEAAIESIQQMPKLYAKHHADFRRTLVRRFPL